MTFSVQQLKNQSRRVDRLNGKVADVLASMRSGSALHLAFGSVGQPTWRLSSGRYVDPEVARLVTNHRNVVGVGDALPLPGALSQTWRYVEV